MMWVQMMENISGGRPSGEAWPPKGYLLEVEDWEGQHLIRSGLAVRHAAPPGAVSQVPAKVSPPPQPEKPAPDVKPKQPAAEDVPVPGPNATTQAWREYALTQGATQPEVAGLTKQQLQQAYGGRL